MSVMHLSEVLFRTAAVARLIERPEAIDATEQPVSVGDLLTTADRPGHAMRVDDPARAFGAVLGKALGSLAHGQGLVPVLVALQ